MIDLHCHILPGIDDGAAGLAVSLGMAQASVADCVSIPCARRISCLDCISMPVRISLRPSSICSKAFRFA
jgi:hypothetical protein